MTSSRNYKGSLFSGGIWEWFAQRWTGVILFIMILTHFFVAHFISDGHITYDKVMERLANPYWKAFDLAFLYLASYHGIFGLLSIVKDYKISSAWKIVILSFSLAILLYLVVFGSITILSVGA